MIKSIAFFVCDASLYISLNDLLKSQVHGGSSGIGTFAIQIAKYQGVRVFVTGGKPAIFLFLFYFFMAKNQFFMFIDINVDLQEMRKS